MYKLLNKIFKWLTGKSYALTMWFYKYEKKFAGKYVDNLNTINGKAREMIIYNEKEKTKYQDAYKGK